MASRPVNYWRGDAMDNYLSSLVLFRKPVAMDETSLFRAASEQIYATQKFYRKLQQCCLSYINRHPRKFENLNEIGTYIHALAILYRHDFLIYQEISKPPVNVTNFGFPRKVILCESFGNHFDCVYPRTFQQKAAICQSLVYEILYKGIFHMDTEVAAAVGLIRKQNMRYNRSVTMDYCPPDVQHEIPPFPPPLQHQYFERARPCFSPYMDMANAFVDMSFNEMEPNQQIGNGPAFSGEDFQGDPTSRPASYYLGAPATAVPRRLTVAVSSEAPVGEAVRNKERQMEITGPPFPYRVAKALDPVVYRNIEYDVWLDERKARFRSVHSAFMNAPFPPGANCLVRLDNADTRLYFGIVQEVDPDGETVIVYLPELGERQQVQMDRLEGGPRNLSLLRKEHSSHQDRPPTRNRHPTWAPRNQAQDVQTNTSFSWPATMAPTNNWQPMPAAIPPPTQPFSAPPPNQSEEKDKGALTPPNDATFPRPATVNVVAPPAHFPLVVQGPLVPIAPPLAHAEGNLPWTPPLTPINFPTPPPPFPRSSVVLPDVTAPFPLTPLSHQPTLEDITTLRQFYQLGGCEYFRQFLAANQQFPRPQLVPQQYQPPIVISPQRQQMASPQIAPMPFQPPPVCQQQVPPP